MFTVNIVLNHNSTSTSYADTVVYVLYRPYYNILHNLFVIINSAGSSDSEKLII